ncbi:MAG: tyrosine-protein phosphatase [Ruminococcaceae bacterium]|nr:tyrosine-protein phosphatase [Oscillospiraceae bacterium]
MIQLKTPHEGETVTLLRDEHLDYIARPSAFPAEKVDWLNLREGKTDTAFPRPVRFSFLPTVDGEITVRQKGTDERYTVKAVRGEAELYNLWAGVEYEWFVKVGEERSETRSFHTDSQPPRMLLVDGICNVRDFGGWATMDGKRIRQGLLYRTSEMDTHCELTPAGAEILYGLGIRTDLDIRGIKDEYRGPVLDQERVRWVNLPLAAYGAIDTEEQRSRYRESYDLLLNPESYPLMCHCWGGIDRTGCWFYILGAMLGVSKDDLDLDYELSSFCRWNRRSRYSEQFGEFLEVLLRYGKTVHEGAVGFLKSCGVSEAEMEDLRNFLLEDEKMK